MKAEIGKELKVARTGWGGARKGAGRKPVGERVTITLNVTRETRETLKRIKTQGGVIGREIDQMVRRYAEDHGL